MPSSIRNACAIAFASATACVDTPATNRVDQSIVGGQLAQSSQYPSVVALENSPGNWFCTGTLVASQWVLTAAHCVEGETAATVKIRFGANDINNPSGAVEVGAAEVHAHPGYDGQAWDNDVAVVKLASAVTNRPITPIRRTKVASGTTLTTVGYGDDEAGGEGILRKLDTPIIGCAAAGDPSISDANVICFDGTDGTGSCFGDSGGPAFFKNGSQLEVSGVTSGGTAEQCSQSWNIYTSVVAELAFIDQYVPASTDPGTENPDDPGQGTDPGTGSGSGSGNGSGSDADAGADTGGELHAGCSAGGDNAGFVFGLAVLVAVRRRRVRQRRRIV